MDPLSILSDKSLKPSAQSAILMSALRDGSLPIQSLIMGLEHHKEVVQSKILGVIEGATRTNPHLIDEHIVTLLIKYLSSNNPSLLRESCRILANVIHLHGNRISEVTPLLLKISSHEGTVVRWGGATAWQAMAHCTEEVEWLQATLKKLLDEETQSSIKQIYLKALKALMKRRS